jgi:hypothetical protein
MPLLRSRTRVHRAKLRFGMAFYLLIGAITLTFAGALAGRNVFGWW